MEKWMEKIEEMRKGNPTDSQWNALIEEAADDYTITHEEYWKIYSIVMDIIMEEFGA